jgi:thiol-disulfide isomerase/thioredoxin
MKQISLFFIIACLTSCFGTEPQKTGLEGKTMPDFSIMLTDSMTSINSRDIPAGKPIVLLYLSPYCPYCKAQTKEIIDDMNKLKNINFYFITNFPLSAMKAFDNEYQLAKHPNITTGIDTGRVVSDYFEIAAVPYIAVYGKDKKLKTAFVGKTYSSQLKKAAEE